MLFSGGLSLIGNLLCSGCARTNIAKSCVQLLHNAKQRNDPVTEHFLQPRLGLSPTKHDRWKNNTNQLINLYLSPGKYKILYRLSLIRDLLKNAVKAQKGGHLQLVTYKRSHQM